MTSRSSTGWRSSGERAMPLFGKPDAGIWEFRGIERTHTLSSAMSWAACDRLARIAGRLQLGGARRVLARARLTSCARQLLRHAWSENTRQLLCNPRRRCDRCQPAAAAGTGDRDVARSALHAHACRGSSANCASGTS